jgi:AraC-like DNA-binding protein
MSATVSAPYVRLIVTGAQRARVDLSDLLTPDLLQLLEDPDGRVERVLANQLWQALARRSGDDAIGLHLAEQLEAGAFAVMDYASRNAPDLRQALLRFARYGRLINDGARIYLTDEGQEARLGYTLPGLGLPQRQGSEFFMATWLCTARQMTAQHIIPLRVLFEHPRPKQCADHMRLFGCEVLFGAETNEIAFDSALMGLPLRCADLRLGRLLDRYADELLQTLPQAEGFLQGVRRVITETLRGGDPSVEVIATRLGTSPRTLQRRLQEEQTSHKQLLDEIRHELALRYLDTEGLSIGEVSFLLGFSEPSAFHRAFKRWTGATPGAYRRQSPS